MAAAAESTSKVVLSVTLPGRNVRVAVPRTASRLAGVVSVIVTAPVNPLTAVTVIVVSPTNGPSGVPSGSWNEVTKGPILVWEDAIVKSGMGFVTLTVTVVVLDRVAGPVTFVPVIVSMKLDGLGTAVQLTVSVVPDTVALHPVEATLVENTTVPVNPLIGVNDSAEVLGVPVTTFSVDGVAKTLKSTTWKVTVLETLD